MLELWKPIQTLKEENNPVIFDQLGFKYTTKYSKQKSIRPFVIFYDDKEDCYYFLKSQSAHYSANHPNKNIAGQLKIPKKGEVLISYSEDGGLFKKDSYVDCSQIFKCNRELLESLVDKECDLYKYTNKLKEPQINKILVEMCNCIFEIPPYLSILEIKLNEQEETYAKSLYLCDEKLDDELMKLDDYDLEANGIDADDYYSNNLSFSNANNIRYNTGINFCKMFLNEYFPNEIEEFIKIQDLQKSNSKEKEM